MEGADLALTVLGEIDEDGDDEDGASSMAGSVEWGGDGDDGEDVEGEGRGSAGDLSSALAQVVEQTEAFDRARARDQQEVMRSAGREAGSPQAAFTQVLSGAAECKQIQRLLSVLHLLMAIPRGQGQVSEGLWAAVQKAVHGAVMGAGGASSSGSSNSGGGDQLGGG